MLDSLLGRGKRERVAELESELERVESELDSAEQRLEAEERRRSDAVRERQNAQEEVNRLEDRVAQLEGTVERLREDEVELEYRRTETLGWRSAGRVVERLQSLDAPPDGALTAVIDDGAPSGVREAFGTRAPLLDRAAPCVAVTDENGLLSAALRPPILPETGFTWDESFHLQRRHVAPEGAFTFALVRSDLFALGEYRGDEQLSFEGFDSDVKGDHSKGGYSQGRFERRRDAQIDEHVDACEAALADYDAERLYLVGDRRTLGELDVDADATAAVDATGSPREALEDAFEDFWTTRLYLL